ncbi:response regulator [Halalkalibacter sp. AB-rgal2]|uniref:response regulator transcription factor n=1 Tax=Halalkalibacter sp. AB-rgal2 TaxID=3242695 RepID=UPI00359DF659
MMNRTILVVDDEPRTREGISKTLEQWAQYSIEVISASTGRDAIKIVSERQIDILITDIRMPEMTGLEVIQLIADMEAKPIVLIMSAYSDFYYAQEAIRHGVIHYLLKPIRKKELIEAVEHAISKKEDQEQGQRLTKVIDVQLLEQADLNNDRYEPAIEKALRYIDDHLKEKVSLQDVANAVHLNGSYFSTLFKEEVGINFSEYVTRKRIQSAKHLLLQSDMPISLIAEEVGYQTQKYFNKIFKEYEGVTPGYYRKTYK